MPRVYVIFAVVYFRLSGRIKLDKSENFVTFEEVYFYYFNIFSGF